MEKEKIECCSENQVHPDLLKIVNDTMPEETELYDLAELFKVFGDSNRKGNHGRHCGAIQGLCRFYPGAYSGASVPTGAVRDGHCGDCGRQPERHFPPASDFKTE